MRFALVFSLSFSLAASAGDAPKKPPLSGTFQSSLGPLLLREDKAGAVTGVVIGNNACGFKKNTLVLQAARLDASTIAGTVTGCRLNGAGCVAGPVAGDAILLVDKAGGRLNGAVHLDLGAGCVGPVTTTMKLQKKQARTAKPAKDASKEQALALVQEAATFIQLGKAEEARAKCKAASTLDPQLEAAWRCIGVTFYVRERTEEALEAYNKALEVNPIVGDTYYNIACLYAAKQPDIALNYLRLALANGFLPPTRLLDEEALGDFKPLQGNPAFEALRAQATP